MINVLCPICDEWIEGLLDYENHRRDHEREPIEVYGTIEHEMWLMDMERRDDYQ